MAAIEVNGLTKAYGDFRAIDSLDFTVEEGEIFGFLGPNGAGKTTTIRTLLGFLSPTEGSARILDANIQNERELIKAKEHIGYLPDSLSFDEDVTGNKILEYFGDLRGDEDKDKLLEYFHPPLDRPVREYSAGNRRMLGIIQAFMHNPDLVIMDEPTTGLDPLKQDYLHEFIEEERARGCTIFFSSHILSEVQRVCDRVGILRQGKLITLEDIDSLLSRGGKNVRIKTGVDIDVGTIESDDIVDIETIGDTIQFTYTGDYDELVTYLTNFTLEDILISEPDLEEIFMHYYGNDSKTGGE